MMIKGMNLREPDPQFAIQSEWDAFWIPKWYELDQDLIVGQEKEYLFFEGIPGWIIREIARRNKPCPHLIFDNGLFDRYKPLVVMKGEVLQIHHDYYGKIKSIVNETFRMKILLESGESILLNTEERTGAIWDAQNEKWLCQTQQGIGIWDDKEIEQIAKADWFDWSMSVRFRVIDPDPYKIFSDDNYLRTLGSGESLADVPGSLLHEAAQEGILETIRQLIETGTNINMQNVFGDTPLLRASKSNRPDAVRMLLEAGANPNIQNKDGITPLHTASEQGYIEIVKTLLDSGSIVDPRDKYGITPLFEAAGNGHQQIIQLLLNAGADNDAESAFGDTAILYADLREQREIVKLLKQTKEKTK
jgi:hypothetical protein